MAEAFVDALDGSATQSKTQTKLKFFEVETSVEWVLNRIFPALNQRHCREEPVLEIEVACIKEEEGEEEEELLEEK